MLYLLRCHCLVFDFSRSLSSIITSRGNPGHAAGAFSFPGCGIRRRIQTARRGSAGGSAPESLKKCLLQRIAAPRLMKVSFPPLPLAVTGAFFLAAGRFSIRCGLLGAGDLTGSNSTGRAGDPAQDPDRRRLPRSGRGPLPLGSSDRQRGRGRIATKTHPAAERQ